MYMVGGTGRVQRGRPYRSHRRWMQPQPQQPLKVVEPFSWGPVLEVVMAFASFALGGFSLLMLMLFLL